MARRGQSRRGRRGRQQQPKPRLKGIPQSERVKMPDPPPKRQYTCALTKKPITNVLTAIAHPDSQEPVEFDAVVQRLAEQEDLGDNQRIAYIGEGSFGVVEERRERGKYSLVITKKIPYEDSRAKNKWRQELSPGISRDYVPQPPRLTDLYSEEEMRSFPRFEVPAGAYLTRSN